MQQRPALAFFRDLPRRSTQGSTGFAAPDAAQEEPLSGRRDRLTGAPDTACPLIFYSRIRPVVAAASGATLPGPEAAECSSQGLAARNGQWLTRSRRPACPAATR